MRQGRVFCLTCVVFQGGSIEKMETDHQVAAGGETPPVSLVCDCRLYVGSRATLVYPVQVRGIPMQHGREGKYGEQPNPIANCSAK